MQDSQKVIRFLHNCVSDRGDIVHLPMLFRTGATTDITGSCARSFSEKYGVLAIQCVSHAITEVLLTFSSVCFFVLFSRNVNHTHISKPSSVSCPDSSVGTKVADPQSDGLCVYIFIYVSFFQGHRGPRKIPDHH